MKQSSRLQMLQLLKINLCHFRLQIITWATGEVDLLWFCEKQVRQQVSGN